MIDATKNIIDYLKLTFGYNPKKDYTKELNNREEKIKEDEKRRAEKVKTYDKERNSRN